MKNFKWRVPWIWQILLYQDVRDVSVEIASGSVYMMQADQLTLAVSAPGGSGTQQPAGQLPEIPWVTVHLENREIVILKIDEFLKTNFSLQSLIFKSFHFCNLILYS